MAELDTGKRAVDRKEILRHSDVMITTMIHYVPMMVQCLHTSIMSLNTHIMSLNTHSNPVR